MKVHVHAHEDGHGQGHGPSSGLCHPVAGRQLVPVVVRSGGVDGQHVPVDWSSAGQRHTGHQVDLVIAEAVQASVGHPLQSGARVIGAHGAQGDHLVDGRCAGRDREPVAVGVGERATG